MTGKSILVVDDDPAILDLITVLLKDEGWRIATASSAEEALGHVLSEPVDLVLTDVVMPGKGGLALLEQIGEARPGMRVVIMTADNTPDKVLQSIRGRAYAFLSKPFSPQTLMGTLTAALEDSPAEDDIVVTSATMNWISIRLRCKLSVADRLTQFFREFSADLNPADRDMISTAFRELLLNAVEHGGGLDPDKRVDLTFIRGARCILYYIRDPGKGFSFENLPHAAVSYGADTPLAHAEVRNQLGIRPGGLGILMTQSIADDVIYSESGNEVVFIKYTTA
jgi:CheY-like chemotaxis protein/anti-sigma regulatory factor (Ser/Thr protein kinase)